MKLRQGSFINAQMAGKNIFARRSLLPQAGGESGGESLSSGGFWLGVDSPPEWVTPPHLVGE